MAPSELERLSYAINSVPGPRDKNPTDRQRRSVGLDQTRKRNALELVRRANLAGICIATGSRKRAEDYKRRHGVEAVGGAYADGTFALEEAAGYPDCRPARFDRCREPVRRQCRRDTTPFFCPHVVDLVLKAQSNGVELVDVDRVGPKCARRDIGDLPFSTSRTHRYCVGSIRNRVLAERNGVGCERPRSVADRR